MEELRRDVVDWADRIKGDVREGIRANIRFGVAIEEGVCGCGCRI
jgi:hypothetical protein